MSAVNPDPAVASAATSGDARPEDQPADAPAASEPDAEEQALPPADVDDLVATLETVTSERDSHLSDLQRLTAEFANFRRQATKRQSDVIEQAAAALAEKLLPVLDACDSALSQGASDIAPIHGALLDVLEREGLEVVAEAATSFDPERHEAVMHEPSDDDGEPMVSEVMRAGYVWKGRVLRPAMVRVRG